jgi:hypothetical protein
MGQLEMVETYVYYEGPRLFAAKSASGLLYLGLFVEESEEEGTETYLYALVTEERLAMVRSGGITLHHALTEPEGPVFAVKVSYAPALAWSVNLVIDDIASEWLPNKDARLDIPTPTRPAFAGDGLAVRAARQGRSLAAIRFGLRGATRTEAPIRDIAPLVSRAQQAVDAFGQEVDGSPTRRGAINKKILSRTGYSVVDLQAASFVVILAPSIDENALPLEPDPLAQQSFARLIDLLGLLDDEDAFSSGVRGIQARAISKVRDVLEEVVSLDDEVEFTLAETSGRSHVATIHPHSARRALDILAEASEDSRTLDPIEAKLVGANVRTRSFELEVAEPIEGRTSIFGRMDPDMAATVDRFEVGSRHRVTLRVDTTMDTVTGEPQTKFRLLAIEPLVLELD